VCTPIAALVAPGPRVTQQMPGRPVSLPYASALGHECRAAFLAADDELHLVAGIVEGIEHGQVRFSGHAEREVDAVYAERIHQELAAGSGQRGILEFHAVPRGVVTSVRTESLPCGAAAWRSACLARIGAEKPCVRRLRTR
jgi:hypothetical protein